MSAERVPPGRVHYAWVVAAVTFVVLLITSGVRATPGLFMVPLEGEFGWSRAIISASIAVNIALFGLIGPFAASVMDRWGLRRVVLGALALLAASVAASTRMHAEWQFLLLWGVLVGAGAGVTAMVLAAVVATRWFDQRRGVVLGTLSAANATGQLVFLPMLASVVESSGWRMAALIVAAAAVLVFALVWIFMRDRPADLGLRPYGQVSDAPAGPPATPLPPIAALAQASRSRAFWILAGTFFVCGASTNGLIGTHLISACQDVGIPAVRSAQLLALMGIFDILRTTASGWLTDRYSARHLLFGYYSLRGLSLLFLPATLVEGGASLGLFAVFYGLDWIATVPPTVKLTTEAFGRENTGVIYGWIGASHQLGASLAAFGAGAIRRVWRVSVGVPHRRYALPRGRRLVPHRRTGCPSRSGGGAEPGVISVSALSGSPECHLVDRFPPAIRWVRVTRACEPSLWSLAAGHGPCPRSCPGPTATAVRGPSPHTAAAPHRDRGASTPPPSPRGSRPTSSAIR